MYYYNLLFPAHERFLVGREINMAFLPYTLLYFFNHTFRPLSSRSHRPL